MTAPVRRAVGLLAAGLLLTTTAACGAGGFGSDPPPAPDRTISTYVALGDGFTAAPYAGTTTDEDCLRSADNYPALVAAELDIDEVRDVSCTGAETSALTEETRPRKGADRVPPQIDAVTEDTDLISIGVGIEDRDLLEGMFAVCTALPCIDKITAQAILNDVNLFATDLTTAVRAVQARAPKAYIVLVGYPRIVPAEGACRALPPLGEQLALDAANYVLDEINRQIQSAARQTGSGFVDVATLSQDHELCSAEPWVNGRTSKPGESVAFHPLAAEQRAVADELADLVRGR